MKNNSFRTLLILIIVSLLGACSTHDIKFKNDLSDITMNIELGSFDLGSADADSTGKTIDIDSGDYEVTGGGVNSAGTLIVSGTANIPVTSSKKFIQSP